MSHDDEIRSLAELEELRAEDALADPFALFHTLEKLRREVSTLRNELATTQRARDEAIHKADRQSEASREVRKALRSSKARHTLLEDGIQKVSEKLDVQRAESTRLRADLERVRSSRTFRVGRAVLGPAKLFTSLRASGRLRAHSPSTDGTSHPSSGSPTSAPDPESAPVVGSSARSDDPAPAVMDDPGPDAVSTPAAAAAGISEACGGDVSSLLPPRAGGAVFPPEPDRLMYCTPSTPVLSSGHWGSRTRGVAEGLRRAGADVRVVTQVDHHEEPSVAGAARSENVLDEVVYIHLPGYRPTTSPIAHRLLVMADAFTREALRQRPEIVHSTPDLLTAFAALIAARRVGVPFIYQQGRYGEECRSSAGTGPQCTMSDRIVHTLRSDVLREADMVLTDSQEARDHLVRLGVAEARITVMPEAVDATLFSPLPKDVGYAESQGIRTDVPVIGVLDVPSTGPSPDLVHRVSAQLTERGVQHQMVVVGTAPGDNAPHGLPNEDGPHTLGDVPTEEVHRLLSTFDIVAFTRPAATAPSAASLPGPLETFASMKAVLLPDLPSCAELAGSAQERSHRYRRDDATSLAGALIELIDDEDERRRLGRAARLWVLDNFPWDARIDAVRNTHRRLTRPPADSTQRGEASLSSISIGLIADEFTTKTLAASVNVVALDREHWRRQLRDVPLDLVLVESAWEGNDGQWHRAVGDYGPREHGDLEELLTAARGLQIPTVFWNKEDPVHFRRFRSTAALCDHVVTTDADMIPEYLSTPRAITRTVSTMPFFAQPAIHNPLPTDRPYRHTIAYAGTYYGSRYPDRSVVLSKMLATSVPFGLTIYDRQAGDPDSPYRFPAEFAPFNEGSAPYDDVVASYGLHIAHLNGNSVTDSPSMYSRRVVEIAASGGVTLSGPGRGLTETFGDMIPASDDPTLWRALLRAWSGDPVARVREAWRQMRAVHRSHTIDSALTVLLRTIGIPAAAHPLDEYAVILIQSSGCLVESLLSQSWRPQEVFVKDDLPATAADALESAGIRVRKVTEVRESHSRWITVLAAPVPRTWFEDLLISSRFGTWDRIDVEHADETSAGCTLASYGRVDGSLQGLVRTDLVRSSISVERALRDTVERSIRLLVAPPLPASGRTSGGATPARTIVIAGHDFKFARALIDGLEAAGHTVLLDRWTGHATHDQQRSRELLAVADTVFCEWGLGNAVWYSKNLQAHQRLVVRVHLQELDKPFLRRIDHSRVDAWVFVGELIRRAAVESHGVPFAQSHVVPNLVDARTLEGDKADGARFHLGLVGVVPQRKRVDLAVTLLERLLEHDDRFRLFIKGRSPDTYDWMARRPSELAFYEDTRVRIDAVNKLRPGAIQFDEHGDDMASWYRKIGIALSVSDIESFHFTIADGAASGALPASLAWAGSDFLYPRGWLSSDLDEMAESILMRLQKEREEGESVREQYAEEHVLPRLIALVVPTPT